MFQTPCLAMNEDDTHWINACMHLWIRRGQNLLVALIRDLFSYAEHGSATMNLRKPPRAGLSCTGLRPAFASN